MNEQQALSKMIPPGRVRPQSYMGGVMQVHLGRSCDLACNFCTQASNLGGKSVFMKPDQFEQAILTLKDYFGVIGIFGGNPCMNPNFEEICSILREHIPFHRRGLWSNNPLGKGKTCRETFNPLVSNLNVHLNQAAYDEFKRDWPECDPVGLHNDSRHSPPFVALQDVIEDEEKRWELISNCDINMGWSAMVGVFRGELRGWFCELAGAQSILHQNNPDYPDTGVKIEPGWWKRPMEDFSHQVRLHCHACGIPLRGHGELSQSEDGKEQVSKTHQDVFKPKRKNREVEIVATLEELGSTLNRVTDYLQNGRR